jgi:hypothetical protein
MLHAIRFLEHVGSGRITPGDYASEVALLDVSESQRQALRIGDQDALVELLGAPSSMFFGIFAPDEEPARDEPVEDQPAEPDND